MFRRRLDLRHRHPACAGLFTLALAMLLPVSALARCPVPPALPTVIDVQRSGGGEGDRFAASEDEDFSDSLRQIRRFTAFVGKAADASMGARVEASGESAEALSVTCLNGIFEYNARAGALLGRNGAMQSGYEQQWALAGLSVAAFKLARAGKPLSPGALDWLVRMATEVMRFHDTHGQLNNHILWASLGVGTTGYLTRNRSLIDWANAKTARALSEVAEDGTLPREMRRGTKASHYHFFAAIPAMIYARIRACEGDPMTGERAALARLEGALHHILAEPQWLAERAGAPQAPVRGTGWLAALERGRLAPQESDTASGRTGGRMSTLVSALACAR